MRVRCEFKTCKHNSENGRKYDKNKMGVCCCQENIDLNAFCVLRVTRDDFDGDIPDDALNEDEHYVEGLYCNQYQFK